MIDESRVRKTPATPPPATNWDGLPVADLIAFRDKATNALVKKAALALSDINVEEELLLQLHALRALQNDVFAEEEAPANQKAQVANALSGVIMKLADLQTAVYSSERMKAIENLLIRHLSKLPEDTAAHFLNDYTALVEKI